jgi:acylphosphatase
LRETTQARRFFVRGRVQGVGFRYFVRKNALALGIRGYARNLDDGRVEVYAVGTPDQLSVMEHCLWKGPAWSDVRGVDVMEEPVEPRRLFQIED